YRPLAVHPQRPADGRDQFLRRVADAGLSQVAQVGQVLAHLGVGHAEGFAQLAARNRARAGAEMLLQPPQVQPQPPHAGTRQAPFAAVNLAGWITFCHAVWSRPLLRTRGEGWLARYSFLTCRAEPVKQTARPADP